MRLYALLEGNAETELEDREITGITNDSRNVEEGYLFVCIKGEHFDGHTKAAEMLEKGAAAVVVERETPIFSTDSSVQLGSVIRNGK